MQIEFRDVDSLAPYARNARTHSDEQIAQLGASLGTFGWTNPVLIDDAGGIVAGHGRVLAARKLWEGGKTIPNVERGKVPCLALSGLTEEQRRAYVLADNKLALNAGWNAEILIEELGNLSNGLLELTGFSEGELERFLTPGGGDTGSKLEGMQYKLIVDCDDEAHQGRLLERLEAEGLKCRPLMS